MQAPLLELSREHCLRLLTLSRVGRVGIAGQGGVVIQPVNFAVVDERIIFRTVPGTRLQVATAHAEVAFEADDYAPDGAWGWTVQVQGVADEVTEGSDYESLRVALLRSWAYPGADRIVRIQPTSIRGRGFGQAMRTVGGMGDAAPT